MVTTMIRSVHDELKDQYGTRYTPAIEEKVRNTEKRYVTMPREEVLKEALMDCATSAILIDAILTAQDADDLERFLLQFRANAKRRGVTPP